MRKAYLFTAAALGVAIGAIAARSATAQSAPDRKGFYADIGANYSAPSIELTDGVQTTKETTGGIGFVLGLGTGLKNNKLRLGVQVDYYKITDAFNQPGLDNTTMFYTVAGTYYPAANNLWLRLNLGYGTNEASGLGGSASAGGFVGGLGVGYDLLLGKGGLALSPYLSYMDLFSTNDFGGDLSGLGVSGKAGMFQVGVTFGFKH